MTIGKKAQELAGHDDSKTTNLYRKTRPIRVSPVVRDLNLKQR